MDDKSRNAALIALDWGTSSLRGWLLADDGRVLDSRSAKQGLMQIEGGDFAAVYRDFVGDWVAAHGALPAIACGMIGSRGGWVEAPYVDCPAALDSLAEQLLRVKAKPVDLQIVPGVMQRSGGGVLPNVMRGEETQVLGALAADPALADHGLLVLPGTHCKWVDIENGRLTGFSTYMTGELFAVLREHSILGRPADEAGHSDDPAAFELGVDTARAAGAAGIAATLFSARSRLLAGEIEAGSTLDYLSGLLIGDELRSVLAGRDSIPPLRLIGDAELCARYRQALACFDVADVEEIPDAARGGLWRIAEAAGLLTV